eukprot:jgi/Psemu1/324368/estExt_fgenesh1_pg.C_1390018
MDSFDNSFATEQVVLDDDALQSAEEDDFDPFQIGFASASSTTNMRSSAATTEPAAMESGMNHSRPIQTTGTGSMEKPAHSSSSALPPQMMIKFKIHEEVSSVAHISSDRDGVSDVQIEGTLLAQVVSSDALKNIPFFLESSIEPTNETGFVFTPNDTYAKALGEPEGEKRKIHTTVVTIPKEILGFVKVGTYRMSQSMEHMPLLLEQKVVRSNGKVQIAIQVRSKLSNPDDLSEFAIAVFIPSQVNSDSVEIVTGDGEFDALKRCITWEKDNLLKGQSFMVSSKGVLEETLGALPGVAREELKFPVMLRCRSKDQISSIQFEAVEADGHRASIKSNVVGKSFRILHRLN